MRGLAKKLQYKTLRMSDKLYKIGTNGLVKVTVWLSYIYGLWPRANSTILYTVYGYIFQTLTTFAWTLAKCIGTGLLTDRKEVILLTASSMYCVVAAYRTIVFMRRNKTIDVCLAFISEFQLSQVEYEMIEPKINFFSKLSTAYTSFILSGLISAFLNPVLSVEKVMPVPIWLPYIDWQENERDFIIALVFSITGISSMVVACAFIPIIVWYLIYGISLVIEVLDYRLQNVGYDRKNNDEIFGDLVKYIETDQKIDDNIRKIAKTFSGLFFLQITSSSICLCSIAYLMASESSSENFNDFAMYFSLGGIYVFEIFVLVYFANEISLESDRLSTSIYASNWTGMSLKCRKFMVIIGEKWKKPKQLVVGNIFTMRLSLLTSILNLAYSILNVLRKNQS